MIKKIIILSMIFLFGLSFVSCTMQKTDLSGTELSKAEFSKAELEGKYFCQQLLEEEQIVYWKILQGIQNHEKEISIPYTDGNRILEIAQLVFYDNPELFWVDFSAELEVRQKNKLIGNYILYVPYKYDTDQSKIMQEEIDGQAEQVIEKMKGEPDDYQKMKTAYESIIEMVDYDETAEDSQTIYSALVNHRSVCSGYARTFQYLLNKCGIPCIYVRGTSEGANHAWNIVKYEDTYYYVDVTWGDPVFLDVYGQETDVHDIRYDYFCCGSEKMSGTHIPKDDLVLPKCSSSDLEAE